MCCACNPPFKNPGYGPRDVDVTVQGTSTYTSCDSTDAQLVDPHEE